jgi:hypothetical protein
VEVTKDWIEDVCVGPGFVTGAEEGGETILPEEPIMEEGI